MRRGAVIFDLDGTVTRPVLDFDLIRRQAGLPAGPILESLQTLAPPDRDQALAILDEHERRAAEESTLQPGAKETIATLRGTGHPVAIMTRNCRHWTRFVLDKHGIEVDAMRTREDGAIKPSPVPVLGICRELLTPVQQSWVVGDHVFDVMSGRAAGAITVLFAADHEPDTPNVGADYVVTCLADLVRLVTLSGGAPH